MRVAPTRLHPDWEIVRPIGPVIGRHVVLDVGAEAGWFFHCWKDWCGGAEVHAFEPRREAFEQAKALYGGDPSIRLNCVAVGEQKGSLGLRVMEGSLASSSFLEHLPDTWEEIGFETGEVVERRAPVTTIDDYCRMNSIESVCLMKIDVQGFELAVLRGAEGMLPTVDHILVESAIRPLYVGAPRFSAVFDWLVEHGFHLMAMRAWHRGNNVLVETDMLFRRNDLAPPVDERIERSYVTAGVYRAH
jgi:FkbM family methyltransferase